MVVLVVLVVVVVAMVLVAVTGVRLAYVKLLYSDSPAQQPASLCTVKRTLQSYSTNQHTDNL